MLYIRKGSILRSECKTLTVPVNTVAVMGAGLAKQVAQRYPDAERYYKGLCFNTELKIGKPALFKRTTRPWFYFFPTKRHWSDPSQFEWIRDGITKLLEDIPRYGIESIAIPALGCGLGKLSWDDVLPEIYRLQELGDTEIEVYPPEAHQ